MVRKNIIPAIGLVLIMISQTCFAFDNDSGISETNFDEQQEATPGITSGTINETPPGVSNSEIEKNAEPSGEGIVRGSIKMPQEVHPAGQTIAKQFRKPQETPAPEAVTVDQSYEQVAPQAVAIDQLREQAAPKAVSVGNLNMPQNGPAPVAIPVPVNQLQGVVVGQPVQSPASSGTVYGSPNPVKKMLAPVNATVQGVNVNKSAPAPQPMRAAPAGIVRATQK